MRNIFKSRDLVEIAKKNLKIKIKNILKVALISGYMRSTQQRFCKLLYLQSLFNFFDSQAPSFRSNSYNF